MSATSERFIQFSELSLSKFNARYSTGDFVLSQDGKFLAVVSKDKFDGENSVWIWDASDFDQSLAGYQIPIDNLWSVAFSPDHNELAVGGTEEIIILNWKTGNILKWLEMPNVWVIHMELGSDDTLVLTSSNDQIVAWNLSTDSIKYSVEGITGFEPNSFAISPDEKILVTAAYQGIHLWDFETGQNLAFHEGPTGGIGIAPAIVFSSDGEYLASTGCSEFIFEGCSSGKIIIWRSNSAAPSIIVTAHSGWINNLAFSPNDEILASTSDGDSLKLLYLNSGEIIDFPSMDLPGKIPSDEFVLY